MFLGFVLGFLIFTVFEILFSRSKVLRKKYWDNPRLVNGYHVHHSTGGLVLVVTGLIMKNSIGQVFIGLGVAMIIVHTLFDGRLVFIEKK